MNGKGPDGGVNAVLGVGFGETGPQRAAPLFATIAGSVSGRGPRPGLRAFAREVLVRLLAHGRQVHTEAGRHALELEPWEAWQRRKKARSLPAEAARARLEEVPASLGGRVEDKLLYARLAE